MKKVYIGRGIDVPLREADRCCDRLCLIYFSTRKLHFTKFRQIAVPQAPFNTYILFGKDDFIKIRKKHKIKELRIPRQIEIYEIELDNKLINTIINYKYNFELLDE